MTELGFVHRFIPAVDRESDLVVLALHGTGADENDLIPLARSVAPGAAVLSPRGRVLEHGMPRFFKRLAMGVFDEADLRDQTEGLAQFVEEARDEYGLKDARIVALGYSNGANIAASLLLLRPEALQGAVLLRAMLPLEPDEPPRFDGTPVLLAAGETDPFAPADEVERLADMLREGGADVTLEWHPGGHELSPVEVQHAKTWMAERVRLRRPAEAT